MVSYLGNEAYIIDVKIPSDEADREGYSTV